MHEFTELADRCATFTLKSLREANERTIDALQTSGATTLVKTLQMIQLQKAILAVGMLSIFEAILQDRLNCADGFKEAKSVLAGAGESSLLEKFDDALLAINVLKHGRGRSYDRLVAKAPNLPFKVLLPGDSFFEEGDVSEISTLIEVDDNFVELCGTLIGEVTQSLQIHRPGF